MSTLTAQESMQYVGRLAMLWIGGTLCIRVKVIDCRRVFNRTDCLIVPADGDGEQWVAADRLQYQ